MKILLFGDIYQVSSHSYYHPSLFVGIGCENVTIAGDGRNVHLKLDGGVQEYNRNVPEEAQDYPEVYVYGRILLAKGIYFRHIDGLVLDNVTVETYREDVREDFVFDDVK